MLKEVFADNPMSVRVYMNIEKRLKMTQSTVTAKTEGIYEIMRKDAFG